jgi:hypothetical protein
LGDLDQVGAPAGVVAGVGDKARTSSSGTLKLGPVRRRERKWMRSLVSTSRPITLACRPSIIRSTVSESVRAASSRTM